MKRAIICLLLAVCAVVTVSCGSRASEDTAEAAQIVETSAPLSQSPTIEPVRLVLEVPRPEFVPALDEPVKLAFREEVIEAEPVEEDTDEELYLLLDEIPLSFEEQELLQKACEEFGVPYPLALGLIETETNFRNIYGDNGASSGYMQIQKKWHYQRMEDLGVTDLNDPEGNFRVGLSLLSELCEEYGSWEMALTVYNMGHDPGCVTSYACVVMGHNDEWAELIYAKE